MATGKPRITVTLNAHVYATLKRLSELGGQSMSTIIAEMLESVHDPLMRTVALLDAAAQAPQQVKDGLRASFEAVERDVYGAVGYTLAQMDWLMDHLRGDGVGATAQAGGPVAGGKSARRKVDPRVVTRGSDDPTRRSSIPSPPPSRQQRRGSKGGRHG